MTETENKTRFDKVIQKILFHFFGIATVFIILVTAIFYWTIKQYHKDSVTFWGEEHKPDSYTNKIFKSFPLSFVILEEGPIVNPEYFNVCKNTPLPVVPARPIDQNTFEALCGIGNTHIEQFIVEDEWLLKPLNSDEI